MLKHNTCVRNLLLDKIMLVFNCNTDWTNYFQGELAKSKSKGILSNVLGLHQWYYVEDID